MRTLRLGTRGDDVRDWQRFLRDGGLYAGAVDGSFGARTVEATRAFQRTNGLDDDGVAGNQTLGAAMQRGFDLAPEDATLADGPDGAVIFINDAWTPPSPPTAADPIVAKDPRMITQHQAGVLPCPPNPPPPVAWAYWRGHVPAGAAALANKVEFDPQSFPIG
jgi:peptidoglycan hydrolase-like protein with peptidoglycan-binding domain